MTNIINPFPRGAQNPYVDIPNTGTAVVDTFIADDPDLQLFQAFAKSCIDTSESLACDYYMTAIPLLCLSHKSIFETIWVFSLKDPEFSTRVMGKLSDNYAVIDQFNVLFYSFKKGEDKDRLISFLNKCMNSIKFPEEQTEKQLIESCRSALGGHIYLLGTGRFDLLNQNSYSFSSEPKSFNDLDKYKISLHSFATLANMTILHNEILHNRTAIHGKDISRIGTDSLIVTSSKLSVDEFLNNTDLSIENKFKMFGVIKGIHVDFAEQENNFFDVLNRVIFNNTSSDYLNIFILKSFDNPQYVNDNLEAYEGFISRTIELTDWLLKTHKKNANFASILKDLPTYFKFGDLKKLELKLSMKKSHTSNDLEEILLQEIQDFSLSKNKDFTLLKNILAYNKENGSNLAYVHFLNAENYHKTSATIVSAQFESHLDFAKKCAKDLFIFPPIAVSNTPKNNPSKRITPPEETSTNSQKNPTHRANQVKHTSTDATPTETKAVIINPLERIQETRLSAYAGLGQLRHGHKNNSADVDKALLNAQHQLDHLLCTMLRLVELSGTPLTERQVHAFVVDSISHATLMSEQMVSALCHSCNEKKPELSHDIYNSLLYCSFNAGPLPTHLREWVQNANRGEILVRNLDECSLGISPLQSLLVKTRLLVEGSTAFSAQQVLSETIDYCKKAGQLVHALQIQIDAAKVKPSGQQKHLADPFKNAFSLLCNELSQKIEEGVKIDTTPLKVENIDLVAIRKTIGELFQAQENQVNAYGLNNIFNNLLLHLETEMSSHSNISPIAAHVHCSHVLLLNQMIAEAVLLNLIDRKMVIYSGEDHDLNAMVGLLGMNSKDFTKDELNFLMSGKAVRQLTRYAANYSGSHPQHVGVIRQTMNEAMDLAQNQKFTEGSALDTGYTIANKKTSSALKKISNFIEKDLSLLNGILAKVLKRLQ